MRFHSCKNQCGRQTESLLFCPKDTVTVVFFFPPSILSQLSAWVWNKGTQRKTQERQTSRMALLFSQLKQYKKVPEKQNCIMYQDCMCILSWSISTFFYKFISMNLYNYMNYFLPFFSLCLFLQQEKNKLKRCYFKKILGGKGWSSLTLRPLNKTIRSVIKH